MKCSFQTITVTIKSGFKWYTNKKSRKILTKDFSGGKRSENGKIKYLIRKVLQRRNTSLERQSKIDNFQELPDSAFYCDQIPSCSNSINANYHLFFKNS